MQRRELIVQPLDRAPDVLLHGLLGHHLRRPASHQHPPPDASAFPVILPDAPKRNQSWSSRAPQLEASRSTAARKFRSKDFASGLRDVGLASNTGRHDGRRDLEFGSGTPYFWISRASPSGKSRCLLRPYVNSILFFRLGNELRSRLSRRRPYKTRFSYFSSSPLVRMTQSTKRSREMRKRESRFAPSTIRRIVFTFATDSGRTFDACRACVLFFAQLRRVNLLSPSRRRRKEEEEVG